MKTPYPVRPTHRQMIAAGVIHDEWKLRRQIDMVSHLRGLRLFKMARGEA